ncbi:MAG: 1-(5-phosphoribosyl)-5-[(5-phosphoribosylamino)methylideneamino]imidazole-4-carboxamide isomerase [Syntrophales bacterium]|jgi:phosphoribosylformimino-5-aminoimidazole carboxamide ribotide isomerase|nr:1-(5-phosphoribosyl)-5-[(5-phosphoribosylamino)methylideneamino]imidazole-4-carboxamide isomerase [Syntrophales bacterium]
MIVIPAIDLRKGRCVRLSQGDFNRVSIYEGDPAVVASVWKEKGAERLHVVDLDGSLEGSPRQRQVISAIISATGLPVEVGGGIRNMETVEDYLKGGARWVILGTAAFADPSFVKEACRAYPGQVILGIDAAGGKAAVHGWTKQTQMTPEELALRFAEDSPAAIIFTDISRDGMETGLNRESTAALAMKVGMPVIASGGVAGIGDIEKLLPFEKSGVIGVVVGKALYTGALSLEEAIACAKKKRD